MTIESPRKTNRAVPANSRRTFADAAYQTDAACRAAVDPVLLTRADRFRQFVPPSCHVLILDLILQSRCESLLGRSKGIPENRPALECIRRWFGGFASSQAKVEHKPIHFIMCCCRRASCTQLRILLRYEGSQNFEISYLDGPFRIE
jgi:hypothetical protein